MKSTDIIKPTPLIAPIANDGLKNTIPDNATGSNYASIAEGFPEMTMKAPKDGGLPPWGQDFNGMFYLMSSQTCFLQNGGIITFDQAVSDKIGGYPQGAILDYMTPNNIYVKVRSLIDDNTYNFVTTPSYINGEHWEEITMSALTSWGDITGTLSNQTDLTDYVNQSKALETGSVSSDADVYADVLKYKNSGTETGIDVIKPDNYEVVGTPTISDDAVFSPTSSTSYITFHASIFSNIGSKPWEIKWRAVYLGENNTNSYILGYGYTNANTTLNLGYFNQSQNIFFNFAYDSNGERVLTTPFYITPSLAYIGKWYSGIVSFDGIDKYTLTIIFDDGTTYTKTETISNTILANTALPIEIGRTNVNNVNNRIDLNSIQIWVDGNLIYQPCLKIPYTLSKTGSKIVDAAYRDRVQDMYEQYGYAPYYTIDEENQNFTLPMGEIYGMIERKSSGGGGLEIGDIGIASLGVDESKGLRRYLNGSIMNINSNTQAFVDKLKSAAVVFPALTCTEEEWQSIVSSSALGQCGKFVIDETAGTVRLPKVVKLQGCLTLANISNIVDAQLPDIEFNMRAIHYGNNNGGLPDGNALADGAAQASNQVSRMTTSGTTSAIYGADFNIKASRSSSVYEADATVQEEAVQYPYFIQIATGVENEVNITNEIELNNPYTLFESKYVQASLYNSSWLLSNGTFYSKSVYVTAYEALNVEYNSEVTAGTTVTLPSGGSYTKRGLPVKLSTDEYTDYDFVINQLNETFRLPLKNGMEGVLADTIVSNGQVIKLQGSSSEANLQGLAQNLNGICANLQMTSAIGYGDLKFGSETGLTLANSNSQQSENYNLYYYVGETVQNATLINAAMLGETIPELTQKIAVCRGVPDYSQKTEIEANTTYQLNADSMIFWYTSGATNNPATITISANSDLSSPVIYSPFYINADGHTVLTFIVPAGYYFKVSRNMTSTYTKSFYCPLKGGN